MVVDPTKHSRVHPRWKKNIAILGFGSIVVALVATVFQDRLSSLARPALHSLVNNPRSLYRGFANINMTGINPAATSQNQASQRGEVYFLSHGGPPSMYDTKGRPYAAWQKFGKAVEAAKPKGLVVVSAHWEDDVADGGVTVNTDATNPLIYDFYNFPKHYYSETFGSRGDAKLLGQVQNALRDAGLTVRQQKRGLDHGVWVPFKVAFDGQTDIPVVQVSLPGDNSPVSAAKLGKALAALRDQGYGIMGTGQVVHNLRDLFSGAAKSYGAPYLSAVTSALNHKTDPLDATIGLFKHPLYKQAHPTQEHLLPLVMSVGAIDGNDSIEEIYTEAEGALGWGMWRWVPKSVAA